MTVEQVCTEYLVWVAIVAGIVAALLSSGGQKQPVDASSSRRERQRPSLGLSVLAAFLLGRSMD